ncbi:uncharacterized protein [Drosophila suzukii]|uniref:Uncharacterized protein isoform X1 n=1 Tax=Drosophila suzukii TaxID=28584 RepID=A0AB39ZVD9_DROSZ|nr:uncharacterized protein LOC108020330 isoform X1 [Drosophila suzukii]
MNILPGGSTQGNRTTSNKIYDELSIGESQDSTFTSYLADPRTRWLLLGGRKRSPDMGLLPRRRWRSIHDTRWKPQTSGRHTHATTSLPCTSVTRSWRAAR